MFRGILYCINCDLSESIPLNDSPKKSQSPTVASNLSQVDATHILKYLNLFGLIFAFPKPLVTVFWDLDFGCRPSRCLAHVMPSVQHSLPGGPTSSIAPGNSAVTLASEDMGG